ncbi:prostate stem cell antigen-like isoform X2 [Centropristis striata]|nr:prostate stem cell antigen-like isoform X2 [Centropristis striata]
MNRFLWSCAALLTLSVTVESLQCYTCEAGILGTCLIREPVNCSSSQDRCFSGVANFKDGLLADIHERGCTVNTNCKNSTGTILNINYTVTKTCCSTNLCNGASSVQLPLAAALCAALVAVWSQWGL